MASPPVRQKKGLAEVVLSPGRQASPVAVTAVCIGNGLPLLPLAQSPVPVTLALVNRRREMRSRLPSGPGTGARKVGA